MLRLAKDSIVTILRVILVALVALEHLYFLYLEMFAWTTPRVQRIFGTTPEIARDSKVLAANQGLYNGFLTAGLVGPDPSERQHGPRDSDLFSRLCAGRSSIWRSHGQALDSSGARLTRAAGARDRACDVAPQMHNVLQCATV